MSVFVNLFGHCPTVGCCLSRDPTESATFASKSKLQFKHTVYISAYMIIPAPGLGTRLRTVLALLDNDVETLYSRMTIDFRPRFYPLVRHLLRHGSANVSELAAAAGVTQPAATQTVGEMEKLGLIEVNVATDRRVRRITLSNEGREIADKLDPVWSAIELAATQLDTELPFPLTTLLDATIAMLREQSFISRIDTHLSGD